MLSYAEFIEMKRADVHNYAVVRQVIEMKQTSVNYSFVESFACFQMRIRNFATEKIKSGVNWYSHCALYND